MKNKEVVEKLIKDTEEICKSYGDTSPLGGSFHDFKKQVFKALVEVTSARGLDGTDD